MIDSRTVTFLATVAARQRHLARRCSELLQDRRQITLEVGCGHGHFLAAYSAAHPEEFCVGIDILKDRLERADRKVARTGIGNAVVLKAEAMEFLGALPQEVRIRKLFVLFPDPWPKRRHRKNRLLASDFLSAAAQSADPAALLRFRTDHEDYFQSAVEAVRKHPHWSEPTVEPWEFETETIFQRRAAAYRSFTSVRKAPAIPPEVLD